MGKDYLSQIPLLQSEERCPKSGVVGEKEFLNFMINRYCESGVETDSYLFQLLIRIGT
ncbi:hypothetical protein HMPREF9447_03019 [Bacteroides oleiciplenus YIT 12058]|uniref:Uncharacterized protein n=1 Tax=Bacteroides oleiciplenus YIT 12058 TaxID=742727 RepID=K9E1M8_9BACE|nr:hypothetical protein HMPREF9447_03019 [Bacteroides oleiciplenus YIT 12058]